MKKEIQVKLTDREIRIIEKTFKIVSELHWVADAWKKELEIIKAKLND